MPIRPFVALMMSVVIAAPAFAADDPAAQRLSAYDDAVVAVMKQKPAFAVRVDRFEALVRSYYDMSAIAALVVGPGWAATAPADRAAAVAALTHHSAVSLARNFASFSGERFTIDPAVVTRGSSRIVRLTISSGSTRNVLLYRMQPSGATWRIVDVVADGVSQVAVQRADLAGAVASGGAAGMARKLAELDARAR